MRSLKHVLRRFARSPMFTSIALITLALGIGANTAIFSVVNGILIKPLPYPKSEQLVGIWHRAPGISGFPGDVNVSPTMYFTYGEENRTFQDIGLWSRDGVNITGAGEPEQVQALDFTYGVFEALGIQPAVGRWFSKADDTPGTPQTAILTYGYWQRRFGGNLSVIGQTINVDAEPHTIIGVMPQNFSFENTHPDMILPPGGSIAAKSFSATSVTRASRGSSRVLRCSKPTPT